MPPKRSSSLEKLKQDRRQLRRTFTKTYNDVSSLLTKQSYTAEEISQLQSTSEELNAQFTECKDFDNKIRQIAMEENTFNLENTLGKSSRFATDIYMYICLCVGACVH